MNLAWNTEPTPAHAGIDNERGFLHSSCPVHVGVLHSQALEMLSHEEIQMAVQFINALGTVTDLRQRTERKFYITPAQIGLAYGVLRHVCRPDRQYPAGQINSLYFDTLDLDEHHKSESGDFRKDKVRIRWYGEDDSQGDIRTIFLELKSKQGFAGTKRRLRMKVPADWLTPSHLVQGIIPKAAPMWTAACLPSMAAHLSPPAARTACPRPHPRSNRRCCWAVCR